MDSKAIIDALKDLLTKVELNNFKPWILPSLATLITSLISYASLKTYLGIRKYRHIPGPPTKGIAGFFFGNLPDFNKYVAKDKCVIELLEEWSQQFGQVYKIQSYFGNFMVVTTNQKATKEILIEGNFPKIKIVYDQLAVPFGERFLGQGLLTIYDNKKWKHNRGLLNPAFHKQVLMNLIEEFNSKGDILLERIRSLADGKTVVTLFNELNHATLDVIASVAFGMNPDCINNPNNKLNKYISEGLLGSQKVLDDLFFSIKPKNWSYIKDYKKILKKLRQVGREQIESRIKMLQEGLYPPNDLLTIILKSHENESFEIENLVDEFITFFIAGQETTANALAFCILEITKNSDVFAKLRNELDQVFGSRSEVKFEDLSHLSYTSCVIKETLRLWPPALGSDRSNPEEFDIAGYKIPKNTLLVTSSYLSARREEYFPDALKFNPERFADKNQDSNKNYTYFPFSLGPRNCIGQNFAQIEIKIILSKLIMNFDFELDPNQNFGIKSQTTIRPADGTKCFISPRKS